MTTTEIHNIVCNYPTKHKYGFIDKEMKTLCKMFGLKQKDFKLNLGINTVMVIDEDIITYHCDVERAIKLTLLSK